MLIEQIRADRIVAFKAKENIKKNLLGCLIADACKETKEPEDQKVLSLIKKFIENAKFVMEKAKETDYEYYQASIEIDILSAYQPTQLSEQEIRDIATVRKDNGDNNLGVIMKFFKTNYEGQYDGALVSKIAKEIL